MNRNPVVPFLLILLMGVGLIFFMSSHGANKGEEGEGGEGGAKTEKKFDAATFAKDNCTSCHGQNLEGAMGPKLAGLKLPDKDAEKIIRDGKGAMPAHDASVISDKDLTSLVKYLKEAK